MYKELSRLFNFKLPILLDKEITKYHLDLQTITDYDRNIINELENVLRNYDSISTYVSEKNNFIDFVNQSIEKSDLYKNFNNLENKFSFDKSTKNSIQSFFEDNKDNEDYLFLQFDVKQGNYNVQKEFSKEFSLEVEDKISKLYLNSNSFEEFVIDLLEEENYIHFKPLITLLLKSKPIRQVIYGKLNSKRSDNFLRYLLNKYVIERTNLDFEIVFKSQDEVIYAIPKNILTNDFIQDMKDKVNTDIIKIKIINYKIIEELKFLNKKDIPKKAIIEQELDLGYNVVSEKLKGIPKRKYIYMFKKYILKQDIDVRDTLIEDDGEIFQIYNFK